MPRSPSSIPLAAPVRTRFFTGKLLSADDLTREQEYHLSARRRFNLLTLGVGVVNGLRLASGPGGRVRVSPGVAIDDLGREIIVPETVELKTGPGQRPCWVLLQYAEELIDPLPGGAGSETAAGMALQHGAIRETYRLWISPTRPSQDERRVIVLVGKAPAKAARTTARRRA